MEEPLFVDHRDPQELDDAAHEELGRRFEEDAAKERETRQLIVDTYKAVWTEFNTWYYENCKQNLRSLAMSDRPIQDGWECMTESLLEETMPVDDDSDDWTFTVTDWEDGITTERTLASEVVTVGSIEPYPKYEACTPTSRNIRSDQAVHSGKPSVLRFIPYADEPNFDAETYIRQYSVSAWQTDANDPNVGWIQFETVCRLQKYGITPEDIDGFKILPPLLGHKGLLWRMRQRDPILWPTEELPAKDVFLTGRASSQNLEKQIQGIVDVFCPIPNCQEVLCLTHKRPSAKWEPGRSRRSNADLRKGKRAFEACGEQCYITMCQDDMDSVFVWSLDCETIWKMFPDNESCHVAELCRIPCAEAFLHRCRLLPDEEFIRYSNESLRGRTPPGGFRGDSYEGFATPTFSLSDFCCHLGPCDQHSKCPCYEKNVHCQRSCRCISKCALRDKGCRCKNGCGPACACAKKGWECDPERCGRHRNGRKVAHKCDNQALQKQSYVALKTKISSHGLGTFAIRSIPATRLIGEYTAEIFLAHANTAPLNLHWHRGLNYSFDLNPELILDAAFSGNETRFINHGWDADLNVEALVRYVNGEHRIGFYTTRRVKAGEELHLDYGDKYWQGSEEDDAERFQEVAEDVRSSTMPA
ncbi:hypothetical protein OBBRIDRAFT_798789 [Obba rivulosa]|uniref:SET domain-containing protein n=1 Tax=Obba rivulosa TaxID=1052685 RepID=A0A8E2AMQ6_9APHY|nr:hypothetical protein OBBRIDRAFT_798789 [Obba rivulosa]